MKAAQIAAARAQVADEIARLIDAHGDALGPAVCVVHGADADETGTGEDCTPDCEMQPVGDLFARSAEGWFLTVGYGLDVENHSHYVQDITPPRQSRIYTTGLVRIAGDRW